MEPCFHVRFVRRVFPTAIIDPHKATSFRILHGMGQFSYCRSPQGMKLLPAYFQRLLDYVPQRIKRIYVYIENVLMSVNGHKENVPNLIHGFSPIRRHNLKVKPSKCQFGTAKIMYLGICKDKGISPGEAKTESIKNLLTLVSLTFTFICIACYKYDS